MKSIKKLSIIGKNKITIEKIDNTNQGRCTTNAFNSDDDHPTSLATRLIIKIPITNNILTKPISIPIMNKFSI
jgi:hypothetical protein